MIVRTKMIKQIDQQVARLYLLPPNSLISPRLRDAGMRSEREDL